MEYGFIKVGSATPELKVADITFNISQIKKQIDLAQTNGVKVLVFPELSLCGYTCADLFFDEVLLSACETSLKELQDYSLNKEVLVFVGAPVRKNGKIYNTAVAIYNGKILGVVPKTFLPNYDGFYEKRWFSTIDGVTEITLNGEIVPFGANLIFKSKNNANFTVSAELCEDLFVPVSPSVNHSLNGANIIVNLSAIPHTVGREENINKTVSSHSAKIVSGYVYANAGLGESTTDCVYSGYNLIAENGKILSVSKPFTYGLTVSEIDVNFIAYTKSKRFNQDFKNETEHKEIYFDIQNTQTVLTRKFKRTPFIPSEGLQERTELILRLQAEGLKRRIEHTHAKCVVIGLSGGLDSTLALIVAVKAMELLGRPTTDVFGVTMPCFGTTGRTYNNTLNLAKCLKVTLKTVNIEKAVTRHLKDVKHPLDVYDVTYENAQARERTQVLMDLANMKGGLVVGTGDLSELALGWATYNGDHMSMYGVNGGVPKTLIRFVIDGYAKTCKPKLKSVLNDILDTPVSPELLPADNGEIAQKTEDIVGPYLLHDFYLYYIIGKGYSPKKAFRIAKIVFNDEFDDLTLRKWLINFVRRFFAQQFKRSCLPDGVKVGSISFSPRTDWKMPSDAFSTLWLKECEEL